MPADEMTKWTARIFVGLLLGCGPGGGAMHAQTASKQALKGGVAEFKVYAFDGESLKGRILIGATGEAYSIDGRLVEEVSVELKNLRACDTHKVLTYYLVDRHVRPAKPEDSVVIRPGYWYGADMQFFLFDKALTPELPDCFEGEMVVKALDRRVAATLALHVTRTDKPEAPASGEKPSEGAEK